MPREIRIPRLGWSMEEGVFHGWLRQEGEPVRAGDPLFELEGDKAIQEIEASDDGVLCIPPGAPLPGTVLAVGAVIGYLLAEGEGTAGIAMPDEGTDGEAVAPSAPPLPEKNVPVPPAPPSVRRLARERGVSLSSVTGTGPAGRVTREDVHGQDVRQPMDPSRPASTRGQTASPRARRLAGELGIDWTRLDGTGAGGRVREADVRRAAEYRDACPGQGVTPSSSSRGRPTRADTDARADSPGGLALPRSPRRKVIADRLRTSRERTVPVTLTAVADASPLVELRNQFKRAAPDAVVPSWTEIVVCLAATVLRTHRRLAARWDEERSVWQLPEDDGFHVGIAVDSPEGLIVPVVRDVARSSLEDVVSRARDLIERGRIGELTAAEMQGGVFTVSNLGGHGIDAFTPVINYPETAILGLGEIRREAVVLPDDRIVPGRRVTLSLTFDHAAIDGAPAAAFLRDLRHALESPAPYLLNR